MCEATQKLTETDGTMSSLSQTFSYDFEDRLTSWSSNGTTLNQTQSWNLSLEGAWNSTTVNGNTETRTFNQTYETLFSNANPMSHDRKGNLTQNKDGSLYTWDFDNQLAFSTSGTPTVNAAYAYDALGRRVSKSSGNTVTVFVHSNYQIATEYKSVNGGAFTEHQSFVYATYIDDPIALISTNGTYFYHSNQQFSIAAITDSNGNLSERYGYNAYGKPVVITDSILVDNPYFFTGRQLDSETGLFYFSSRYYDANLGQFISRDKLGYVDGMSMYSAYFAANHLDPFGEQCIMNKSEFAQCDSVRPRVPQPTTKCNGRDPLQDGCSVPFTDERTGNYDRISGLSKLHQMAAHDDEVDSTDEIYIRSGLRDAEMAVRNGMSEGQLDIKRACTFRFACNAHDLCYNTCYPEAFRDGWSGARSQCDTNFLADMRAACDACAAERRRIEGISERKARRIRERCRRAAYRYYLAVRAGGSGAFEEGQRNTCECVNEQLVSCDKDNRDKPFLGVETGGVYASQ